MKKKFNGNIIFNKNRNNIIQYKEFHNYNSPTGRRLFYSGAPGRSPDLAPSHKTATAHLFRSKVSTDFY